MTTNTRRATRLGLAVTSTLLAYTFGLAGIARADTGDDLDMQQRLTRVGVYLDPDTARETGHAVCSYLEQNPTFKGIETTVSIYEESFTPRQAGGILGSSLMVYCPDLMPLCQQWASDVDPTSPTPVPPSDQRRYAI